MSSVLESKPAAANDSVLAEKLTFSRNLQAVTNKIHATSNIDEIMLELSQDICSLFNADRLTLLSLDPKVPDEIPDDAFHDWRVLGKTDILDIEARKKLVAGLKQGAEGWEGAFAGCFNPRHGIRVAHKGKSIDLVICFECRAVHVFGGENKDDQFQITDSAQAVFDQSLRAAGVPLAEKAKK